MGLKQIEMYDISNTIVTAAPEQKYSWQDAVSLVQNACKPLGEEYCRVLQRAFDERWIDYKECKGKRSGAYSSGCYDSNPYILLTFDNTLDGVSTLAHELGHSLHSYFSHTAQEYHYASYPIFAAEIASTTNELLLHHYLMNHSDDPVFRASLLNNLLDTIRATMFRQTMFAEFEAKIYEKCENDEPLTPDDLCHEYAELNALYHGKAVKQTPEIQYEWARIPHFHYDFYVYQYATGIAAAVKFSQDILAGKTEPYLNFLRAGSSRDVIDVIRDAGVDFATSAPVDAAAALFDETLNELKRCNKK
jgi:oligoendopeptidase F